MPKKIKDREGNTQVISGITSLSPRVYIRSVDNTTGSYPTIGRTGDTRTGVYSGSFDDTKSILVGASDNMILGRQIFSSSQYIDRFVATPSTNPTLVGPGTASFGITDQRVAFTPGQDLLPFYEHDLFENDPGSATDPFYLIGSRVEDVGLGFSNPLKSKTKIEIDLTTNETTIMTVDGGSPAGTFHHHMAYYNKDLKKFDLIGSGAFVQTTTAQESLDLLNIGFGASTDLPGITTSDIIRSQRLAGTPISNFGFPMHPKYHATSSQLTSMSRFISAPFAVEKAVLRFSGSFLDAASGVESPMSTFFILNQRSPFSLEERYVSVEGDAGLPEFGVLTASIPSSVPLDEGGSLVPVNSGRDLVTYMQAVALDPTATGDLKNAMLRELNVVAPGSPSPSGFFPPDEYVMSGTVKSPVVQTSQSVIKLTVNGNMVLASYENGGRNALGLPTGRDLTTAVYGENISGSYQALNSKTSFVADLIEPKFVTVNNPYILRPEDNLVFGWQLPLPYSVASSTSLAIAPYSGKLTLYGSLIREAREFHQGTNQLLTSDSIHEDVRDNTTLTNTSDCLDQFLSEYTSQYSGSYIDQVFDEDLGVGVSRIDAKPNSVIAGQAGTTGSILRGVQLSDQSERFYDSLTPDILKVFATDNAVIPFDEASGTAVLAFGTGSFTAGASTTDQANHRWLKAFPFESRYEGIPRTLSTVKSSPTSKKVANTSVVFTDYTDESGKGIWTNATFLPAANAPADLRDRSRIIFGFGDGIKTGIPGTVDAESIVASSFAADIFIFTGPIYRGFKYGLLNAIPQFSKAIFRHDRYGQFRDMLEQRLFAKFESSGDESREVVSTVFSRVINVGDGKLVRRPFTPEDTSGHLNIDQHARVTKPFFDVEPTNITQNTNVDSLQVANINSLAGGADIDPKNLGLNDFSSFIKG